MAKKEAKLNSIQITQQFEDGMWGNGWENWAEDIRKSWQVVLQQALDAARAGDISKLTEMIRELFEGTGHHLRDCYGILHNQDVREVWSELEGQMVVEPKPAHGHWVLYFKQGCGCTYAEAAAILGLPVQQIEKTKPGRYGYDNSLAYLVHAKYADKHQYDPKAVCTACGHPYTEIAGERMADWLKGRSSIARQKALDGIDDLEQQILDGRVTRQQVLLTDEYYAVYARNKRRCDDAFDTYASRKAYKTIQALDNGEFRLSVFFLTGRAGDGKTRLAKSIIKKLIAESAAAGNRWQVCKTAASNPVDDYCGEEILWMDDVRGTAMSASDWLKLLDPENITSSSARYHNKQVACRCILITSEKDVMEFFMYCRQMGGGYQLEAMDQFVRRIQSRVHVIRSDDGNEPSWSYRIQDSTKRTVDTPSSTLGLLSTPMKYCFTDSECWQDIDSATEVLVNRVIINNPKVWGEKSEMLRREFEEVTAVLNSYITDAITMEGDEEND